MMVQGLEFVRAVGKARGWPWVKKGQLPLIPYLVVVLVSIVISVLLATATAELVNGRFGAVGVGAAAPMILTRMTKYGGADGQL